AEIVAIHSVIAELDHVPNGLDAVAGGAKFAGRRKTEVVRGEVEELIVANVAKADGPEIGEETRIGFELHRPGPDTERKRAFAAERAGVPPNAERSRAPQHVGCLQAPQTRQPHGVRMRAAGEARSAAQREINGIAEIRHNP